MMEEKKELEQLDLEQTSETSENRVDELQNQITVLTEQLDALQSERDSINDRMLRLMAEFDNFRKRSEKERVQLIEQANAGLISVLLPILDDLQRSLASADESQGESLAAGIKMVSDNFLRILAERGLEPIDAVGCEFDPEQHEAIMQMDAEGIESNHVVEEHQKGYRLNGKVIRHARVIVSR